MKPNNENIKKFIITNYIDSDIEPHFALLLKGKWGCGKTYFLDKILKEKYSENYRKDKVIWLSLYGMSEISQVSKKLYELIHPILTSKATKLVFNMVKSAAKFSTGFDVIGNDNNNDISLDFSLPDIEDEEKGIKTKKLIVIDDLERCSIPPEEILGYFSEFILEQNIKAIFIGNTEKMEAHKTESNNEKKGDDSNTQLNTSKFEEIKEKLIGFEFSLEPEEDEAISCFAEELKLDSLKSIMITNCVEIVKLLDFKNLRVIRQSFYFLKQLLSVFSSDEISDNQSYFNSIIQYYFVLFFQKATGSIISSEIIDAIEVFKSEKKSFKKWKTDNNRSSYDKFHFGNVPLQNLYEEIIFEGKIDSERIREDFIKWTRPPEEKPAYIQLQQNLFELNDDNQLKELYKKARKELKNKKLVYYSALLSYLTMELTLKLNGLIETDIQVIKTEMINYITRNRKILIPEDNLEMFRFQTFGDQQYEQAYQEVANFIKDDNRNNANNNLKKVLSKLINELPESFETLCANIRRINTDENRFWNYPILANLPLGKFYTAIKKLSYEKQIQLFHNFNERYGMRYTNGTLDKSYYPDVEFVKKLSQKYKDDLRSTKMSIKNVQRKYLTEQYEELYNWMKKQVEGIQ